MVRLFISHPLNSPYGEAFSTVKGEILTGEVCVGEVISLTLDPSPKGRGKLWFSSPFGMRTPLRRSGGGEGESGSFVKVRF